MIEQIKQELNDFIYPDDDTETLELMRGKSVSTVGNISASDLLEYLTSNKKIATIHDCANNDSHDLQNQCRGLLIAIQSGFNVDLSKSGNASTLSGFVPDVISEVQASEIVQKATVISYPFASVTMQQLRAAKEKTNMIVISDGWVGQRFIKLTVSGVVTESFKPIVTKSNDIYENEPVGRTKLISKTGIHVIDISNLSNPGAPTELTIELGAPNTFTVELI